MMRIFRLLMSVFFLGAASTVNAADIQRDMNNISQFCLHYIETGQHTRVLLGNGFAASGRKYKKSYSRSVIGGTKPVITVDPRKSRGGFGCSAQFGIIKRNDGIALINTARNAARARDYQAVTYTDKKGRTSTAFQKNGILMKIGGSTGSSHSTYSANLYFQRLN